MPTAELSEATRTWLMGFTKSYNKHFNLTGSRFQPHGKAKHHDGNLKFGVDYLHQNPVRANLVSHPSEWGYSSYNEYYFQEDPADCFCDRDLGRQLLALYP
ncbi:hypothetical protein [Neolewinella antarctica]|uniref:Transposase n=1 Tax=Neolewinella antarctica TaxID=442734 RepID=A0ABX0XF45_9BACT|nr:hypothetical protein [Neolewinella antarctica]NJC27493.1 hypothetical protein [Neolewinella antarctica]